MHIALIPGDGTGLEVLAKGVKVVNAACAKQGVKLSGDRECAQNARTLRTTIHGRAFRAPDQGAFLRSA